MHGVIDSPMMSFDEDHEGSEPTALFSLSAVPDCRTCLCSLVQLIERKGCHWKQSGEGHTQ